MSGSRHRAFGSRRSRQLRLVIWATSAAVVAVAVVAVVTVIGIVSRHHPAAATRTPPTSPPAHAPGKPAEAPARAGDVPSNAPGGASLTDDFAELQSTIDGTIGLMIAPAGNADAAVTLGHWTIGPAWSTIKVPLVIAALRKNGSPEITDQMRAAITQSNNAAAESIWEGLGDPVTAAHAVEKVLVEADDHTTVESQKVRPEFTAFGQTRWSLTAQLRFAAFAACDSRDASVRELMGEIAPDQRWGLGHIPDAQFKGGWGPSEAGAYLVRQFGFITNPSSGAESVVAMAVEPASGSFGDGTADLTKVGDWLKSHIAMLPSGRCSR